MIDFPQTTLTPRQKLLSQPSQDCAGSDQSKSDMITSPSASIGLLIQLSKAICWRKGLSPPCTQKIRLPITAATGRQLKASVIALKTLVLSLRLHSSQKPQILLTLLDSWFPLSRKKVAGCCTFSPISKQMHSRDFLPRSTQSPRKRQFLAPGSPISSKMLSRSLNCPCISPQMTTGGLSSSSIGWLANALLKQLQRARISCSHRGNCQLTLCLFSFSLAKTSQIFSKSSFLQFIQLPISAQKQQSILRKYGKINSSADAHRLQSRIRSSKQAVVPLYTSRKDWVLCSLRGSPSCRSIFFLSLTISSPMFQRRTPKVIFS